MIAESFGQITFHASRDRLGGRHPQPVVRHPRWVAGGSSCRAAGLAPSHALPELRRVGIPIGFAFLSSDVRAFTRAAEPATDRPSVNAVSGG